MDVGIGLPATIPGTDGKTLLEWARRSEQRGFSTLGVLDRIVYPNYEPLVALAGAAAVTERIRLTTSILIAPYRANTALIAKQAASVDSLSGGRLVLGVAVGRREDDYEASGVPMAGRGAVFEAQLEEMKRIWDAARRGDAGAIGPPPAQDGGPPLIVGGQVEATFERAAKYGEGWIMGGGAPEQFKDAIASLEEAWKRHGREGSPRKMALAYYALGPNAQQHADSYLHHYYAWLGEIADMIAGSAAISEEMVKGYASAFGDAGCDELIFFPCSTDPEQVDLLASAVL
jgi:alkanesulfonate monooxygenase SsuD/methylene tetrahydromethanopterin reductase-like flavin-dependent oxidoreductase (luciferase family)